MPRRLLLEHLVALEQFRDPQSLPIVLFDPAEDADQFAHYRNMVVARVIVMLLSEPSGKIQ